MPEVQKSVLGQAEKRFWPKVKKSSLCWEWTGALTGRGYGQMWMPGGKVKAHRLSWEIHRGSIPKGIYVLHDCDNPRCVNPHHLFLGTAKSNRLDAVLKGRNWKGKTHCVRGHPMSGNNLYVYRGGKYVQRVCRTCRDIRQKKFRNKEDNI